MKQIQIPYGMRDLFPDDCAKKEELKKRISAVFRSYGFERIETPLIEYYSAYQNTFTSLKEETLYKFIDENGQILVLRTDMTLPIARVCATKFGNAAPPFRFSYCADIYKVRQNFAGKRNAVTDCGVELIGLDQRSDLEILCCALDTMASFSLQDYTLEIGNSEFFRIACEEAGIDSENARELAGLIDNKAMSDTRAKLKELDLSEEIETFFIRLPMIGGKKAPEEVIAISFTESLKEEARRMVELRDELYELGYQDHVTFDFGKVPHLDYYTGIIFEGYVAGIGTSVLSGGRYDSLLAKVGRDLPAIGFGVKVDYLVDKVSFDTEKKKKLYYPVSREKEAILLARKLREESAVEMIPWDQDEMEVTE